jgi:hypothetical protein
MRMVVAQWDPTTSETSLCHLGIKFSLYLKSGAKTTFYHFGFVPLAKVRLGNRLSKKAAANCLRLVQKSYLLSEPRNGQVNARHHCEERSHPYPSWPKPARPASGEQSSDGADHKRAECRRSGPAIPPHLGRQKVHCGIGDITGTVHAQKDDAERRIDVPNGSADPGRFPPVRFMVSNRTVGDMMIRYGRVSITLWHT